MKVNKTKGYTGISFPFRVGITGGVEMTTTTPTDATHIIESMQQRLMTKPKERSMEFHVNSDIHSFVFESVDSALDDAETLKFLIRESLEKDERIEIVDINVIGKKDSTTLNVNIVFIIKRYSRTYNTMLEFGGFINEQ